MHDIFCCMKNLSQYFTVYFVFLMDEDWKATKSQPLGAYIGPIYRVGYASPEKLNPGQARI